MAARMIEKRKFGLHDVSVLGLGTVKFGRNTDVKYPGGGFALPTDAEIEKILDLAIDSGINLIDTAPAYGTSEERLGKLMGARRDKFFLMTKTGEEYADGKSEYNFTAAHTRMSVERSLMRLKTDRLDAVLVHSNRDDLAVVTKTAVIETLDRLREEGKLLYTGVSIYTVEGGLAAIDRCDSVMVTLNRDDTACLPVIAAAAEKGRAVLVKKGLASGHATDAADAVRFAVETKGVTSLIIGSRSPANISANINALIKS